MDILLSNNILTTSADYVIYSLPSSDAGSNQIENYTLVSTSTSWGSGNPSVPVFFYAVDNASSGTSPDARALEYQSPLPAVWCYFEEVNIHEDVLIRWGSELEINCNQSEAQRSSQHYNFGSIARISAKAFTGMKYKFIDKG